jgi:hypothetical protein
MLSKITFQQHFVKFGQFISITLIKLYNSMWGPHLTCHDLSFGLAIKTRAWKGVGEIVLFKHSAASNCSRAVLVLMKSRP